MKTWNHLYSKLCEFSHLYQAAHNAARGKKKKQSVNQFFLQLESNLFELQRELAQQTYIPGKYYQFTIYDPKKRLISAAPFRDQVVHHAICLLLEPIFERQFIFHTYACRKEKGMHSALALAKKYTKSYGYFLKMDIAKFYDNIQHSILESKLTRIIRDEKFFWLLDLIITHAPTPSLGKGLPIGNLTSQYFANFFLNGLDHVIKEELRVKPYLRYMDDFLLFASEKTDLVYCRDALEHYLPAKLNLAWKNQATILAPVKEGVPYLGFKIFPTHTRILQKNWRRCKEKIKHQCEKYQNDQISIEQLKMSVESLLNFVSQANTARLRADFFQKNMLDI